MPEFATPFAGNNVGRKLNKEELIRAIRFSVSAEYEAVQLYGQIIDATDDKLSIATLRDIADEELKHAGQFLRLLEHLSADEEKFYREGFEETDDMLKGLKKK
jgi:rubrerythrin